MSGANLSEGFWCGQNIFSNLKKLKSSNKKVEKLQKLINEIQKKKSKTDKNKRCTYAEKHRMCTQKIRKSKYTQKNMQSYRILEYTLFGSGQVKCC